MVKSDKRALTNSLAKRMVFTGISLNCVWKQPAGNYKLLLPFVQKKLQIECQLRLLSGTDNKESQL
jgi:hypothetical protein